MQRLRTPSAGSDSPSFGLFRIRASPARHLRHLAYFFHFDHWSRPWGVARLFLGLRGVPPRPIPRKGSDSTTTTTFVLSSHCSVLLDECYRQKRSNLFSRPSQIKGEISDSQNSTKSYLKTKPENTIGKSSAANCYHMSNCISFSPTVTTSKMS